jgi:hypothetical protein
MISSRMTQEAIRVALTATEGLPGEIAGDTMMQLGQDRGLAGEIERVFDSVVHHACLADIMVSAIRKPADPPWQIPSNLGHWTSGCFLSPDGSHLRRIVLVSHWSDDRQRSECRSWFTLGEIAHYDLPMQLVVLVIGQQKAGKRSSPWTSGFLHPANHQLRFRKKSRSTTEVFNDKWEKIWREDHAEITREVWLQSMLKDDVLPEVCFRVDIPTLDPLHRQRILQMAERKLERLYGMKEKPEANLSSCDWPVACEFRRCCHSNPEREPSLKYGFVPLSTG